MRFYSDVFNPITYFRNASLPCIKENNSEIVIARVRSVFNVLLFIGIYLKMRYAYLMTSVWGIRFIRYD